MQRSNMERVKTGIPGFDELCEGGLIRGRTYVVAGVSGAGKSIFCLQYLVNGITKFGENGILLATEERPALIRENASVFGWDLKKLEDEGKLAIIDASSTKIGVPSLEKFVDVRPFDIDRMIDQIISLQEEIEARRAVIDSSTSILFHIGDAAKARVELLKISTTLEILGLTTLMTAEVGHASQVRGIGIESFVTDGTIMIYYKRVENARMHAIEVYKMRGSRHDNKIHPFDITEHGIVVHPSEVVYGEFDTWA